MNIVEILFGSHLYGTDTPTSDRDYKSIFVPPAEQIVLQRIVESQHNRRDKNPGEKNKPDDEDREAFALHRYLALLAKGETMALDMLFAPQSAMLCEPAPIWQEMVANRDRLVTRQTGEFVTYCEKQAKKYGIKGSRIHAIRNLLVWFDQAITEHGNNARVEDAADTLPEFIDANQLQFTQIILVDQYQRAPIQHIECCDLKASFRTRLKDARIIYQRMMDRYGARALMAETNEGCDWKALSHAVRIAREAMEVLSTGWITFPRPEAAHLLAIKLGQLPYRAVAEEVETLLDQVKAAQVISLLPDEPDLGYIDSLVFKIYGKAVVDAYAGVVE